MGCALVSGDLISADRSSLLMATPRHTTLHTLAMIALLTRKCPAWPASGRLPPSAPRCRHYHRSTSTVTVPRTSTSPATYDCLSPETAIRWYPIRYICPSKRRVTNCQQIISTYSTLFVCGYLIRSHDHDTCTCTN
jgi:hypothetical protein